MTYPISSIVICTNGFVADVASFQAFFNYSDMRMLLENFSVYHVNAPGQEEAAQPLPDELVFALLILPNIYTIWAMYNIC